MAADLLIIAALSFVVDSFSTCYLQGTIRAVGLQDKVSLPTFFSYYAFGIPVACILSFYFSFDVIGLHIGIMCGIVA